VRRALGLLVVLVALLPACGVSGLSFVQDERVTIDAPKDRSKVDLPLTVRWRAHDFDGTYAVFVDRAPQPPGRTLAWLLRDDKVCAARPGCPDATYLAERDIHPTTTTSITIDRLPDTTRDERRDRHEVTIILLDRKGRRIGESAFTVEFEVARDS
jgi:hypothetical protein